MKISEVIEYLQKVQAENGDLIMCYCDYDSHTHEGSEFHLYAVRPMLERARGDETLKRLGLNPGDSVVCVN